MEEKEYCISFNGVAYVTASSEEEARQALLSGEADEEYDIYSIDEV